MQAIMFIFKIYIAAIKSLKALFLSIFYGIDMRKKCKNRGA